MKILGWNCQGICNASIVRALGAQIKRVKPNVIFLSETKANEERMEVVKNVIKFDNKFVVEAKGSAGGLCMFWKNGVTIKEMEFNKNLIAVEISDSILDWLLVGFYGPPYYTKKKKAWGNLMALLEAHQGPWVCVGDFNCILNEEEQIGGSKGSSSTTNHLKEMMFNLNSVDLGYSGDKFTWAKGKWGSVVIKGRLHRGVASISWRLAYPKATVSHLSAINSDHAPILLDTCPADSFAHKPFRFEAIWLRDEGCKPVIESAWNNEVHGSDFVKLYKKQAATRDALRKWNKEVFGRCQDRINDLLQKIKEIQIRHPSPVNELAEQSLQSELFKWLIRSEILWRKKSRELWLKLGDKNSKFFHLSTVIRRRNNNVDAIKNEDGTWIHDSNQIRRLFRNNFVDLFKEEDIDFPEHLEHLILPCITEEENEILERIPSPEEIKDTLFQMQDLKAPRPDGFPVLFYKQLWPTVGNDIIKAVTSFFYMGSMPKEVNSSLIVLIPKISNPSSVNHFRPISSCNVVYKIISKFLVAKLRPLLDLSYSIGIHPR